MEFEWDEKKRDLKLKKHGMDFIDAKKVFESATLTIEDSRFIYDEQRFITLGMLEGIIVIIAHSEENEIIRVISMRKATKNEQKIYFNGFSY